MIVAAWIEEAGGAAKLRSSAHITAEAEAFHPSPSGDGQILQHGRGAHAIARSLELAERRANRADGRNAALDRSRFARAGHQRFVDRVGDQRAQLDELHGCDAGDAQSLRGEHCGKRQHEEGQSLHRSCPERPTRNMTLGSSAWHVAQSPVG